MPSISSDHLYLPVLSRAFLPLPSLFRLFPLMPSSKRLLRPSSPPRRPTKRQRTRLRATLTSFHPRPFTPYISSNPHFQTICSNFYPPPPPVQYTRLLLHSDDQQAVIQVDVSPIPTNSLPTLIHPIHVPIRVPSFIPNGAQINAPKPPPIAVVLHGLESNSHATVTRRIVAALTQHHFTSYVLNLRSCAEPKTPPSTLRLYHAGFTEDLDTLLRHINHSYINSNSPPPDIYLCGFSLGANLVCQFLGRQGSNVTSVYNVVAAAAACVPFDPTACQAKLDRGLRGMVYSKYLVDTMQSKVQAAVNAGVDVGNCVVSNVRKADRIGRIDDSLIVPVFGFKDRFDYYQKVDSRKLLKDITVPTLVINSKDDPFFDHASGVSLPTRAQIAHAPVLLHLTEHGGHCGFLDKQTFNRQSPGYFQSEFARFFDHVREQRRTPH